MPLSQWKKSDILGEDVPYSLKIDVDKPPRDYLWLSIISFPCNPIFSIIAIVCSVKSRKEKKAGALETADHYGRSAIMFALFGFMLSVFISVLVIDLNFHKWFPELYAKIYDPDYWTRLRSNSTLNATSVSHH